MTEVASIISQKPQLLVSAPRHFPRDVDGLLYCAWRTPPGRPIHEPFHEGRIEVAPGRGRGDAQGPKTIPRYPQDLAAKQGVGLPVLRRRAVLPVAARGGRSGRPPLGRGLVERWTALAMRLWAVRVAGSRRRPE